jgi:hypothetical protein
MVAARPNDQVHVLQTRKRDIHEDLELALQMCWDGGLESHRAHLFLVGVQFVQQLGKVPRSRSKESFLRRKCKSGLIKIPDF